MDINIYKSDGVDKRVLLEFEHLTLTNDDIQEDMTLTEQVNTATDIMAGACCSVQLSFSALNLHQLITKADLAGKEFRYRAGAQTGESDVWREMARRGLYLAVRNGQFWYGVNTRGIGLTIWDGEEQRDAPPQPTQAVKSITIRDGLLYCGHESAPYVTAYRIEADGNLTLLEVTPTAFEIEKLKRYNARESALNLTGNILLDYQKEWADGSVIACMERVIEFNDIGYFTPDIVDRKNDNMLSVTAYDRMTKLDAAADAYLDSVAYPVKLLAFLQGLCVFYGVGLATTSFPNSGYMVQQNIKTANLPGRQLLQWIAQAAVRFARFDAVGRLALGWYAEKGYTITANDYTKLEASEYDTAPIDKVQIRSTSQDIGAIVGDGENAYIVENNPLFYASTDAELRPAAEVIYNEVNGRAYTPYTVSCRGNPLIRAGDIITVESRKGQTVRALIMSRTLKGVRALTDSYEATGNQIRDTQTDWQNQQIVQLRGKINEVSVTVEGTINRLYDANTGDITQLKATAAGLEITVGNQSGEIDSLEQAASQLSGDMAQLKLTTGGLSLAVSNNKLTFGANGLSVYDGGFRIYNGSDEVFSVASDGSGISMIGKMVTKGTREVSGQTVNMQAELSSGELRFFANGESTGGIYALSSGILIHGIDDKKISIYGARSVETEKLQVKTIWGLFEETEVEGYVDLAYINDLRAKSFRSDTAKIKELNLQYGDTANNIKSIRVVTDVTYSSLTGSFNVTKDYIKCLAFS